MDDTVYLKLRDFLDKLPGGLPSTESCIELAILKKLFTPEQATIAMHLHQIPEPAFFIARRLRINKKEAAEKLEAMAKEGLIYRIRIGKRPFYMALQFIVGIYEFHLNTLDRELSEMLEEYFPFLAHEWEKTKTKQLRVVPIGASINTAPAISTYDNIRELVKKKKIISVAPCICQKERLLMGGKCDRPSERCIQFDNAAEYYIENGMGRKITPAELEKLLDMGQTQALILCPTNARDIVNICMCCGCCCGILRMLKTFPRPADHVQSSFQAIIDADLCTACGTCQDRCQMDAIMGSNGAYAVDSSRCIGCGLCIPSCPADAFSLVKRKDVPSIPRTFITTQMRIAKERGIN